MTDLRAMSIDELRAELRASSARATLARSLLDGHDAGEASLPAGAFEALLGRAGAFSFAVPIGELIEVVRVAAMSPVADAPDYVIGRLDLGTRVVPVIDLEARLASTPRTFELTDVVVVARTPEREIGILVSEVFGVEHFAPASLVAPAESGSGIELLRAVARGHGGEWLIPSLARLARLAPLAESDEELP
jgi:purine-binding chemotaxis protein CheW